MNGYVRRLSLLAILVTSGSGSGCAVIDDLAAIDANLEDASRAPARTITAVDLEGLPPPVANYLVRTGVVGRPFARAMRARGEGEIRLEGRGWVPLTFEQYNTTMPSPTRDVLLQSAPWPLFDMEGHDSLDRQGRGRMSIRLNGMPFQESYGPELDVSVLVTYLAEMVMIPSAFLGEDVTFEPIDDRSALVRLSAYGMTVSGTCTFNDDDEIVDFVTDDRYRTVGVEQVRQRWSAPCLEYADRGGLHLCVRAMGIWHEEGAEPREYADFRMNDTELDVFERY